MSKTRIERDSMGELEVPVEALYGAQTQRAISNFPLSGLHMPGEFIAALGLIKQAAVRANASLELIPGDLARAIDDAAAEVAQRDHDAHFPVDVFQTGSGTSSNMNANEVIARLARKQASMEVHPNDHVNLGQSSNDVVPTAIQLSASLLLERELLPAIASLQAVIATRADELSQVAKTGRTHLMDAMPLTFGQELMCWHAQLASCAARLRDTRARLLRLPQGGTAIGTGINAHPEFAARFCKELEGLCDLPFRPAENLFEGIASQDTSVELSGQLRVLAVTLIKIANDLRWMNSGPLAGLGEIELMALQPGSSIMPGKVNPVIPEAVAMISAQVIGNDACIATAGASGSFQLNVMLPVIAYNLVQSLTLLSKATRVLGDSAIAGMKVRQERVDEALARNPILVTALNQLIGYEQGAAIAKEAYASGRPVLEVAIASTDIGEKKLRELLSPLQLTEGGLTGAGPS